MILWFFRRDSNRNSDLSHFQPGAFMTVIFYTNLTDVLKFALIASSRCAPCIKIIWDFSCLQLLLPIEGVADLL